ncbi:histone-lysine N-methyltransferase SETMAR [Plakobranchus ocellatus]|uniref:Histone-lysine N-methyltransferase SETMAR n=1 Tax=Plakobranchus ocellatus TaxID=259542 RepID=A0AAV4BH11_9GAST|nr:histone-lysine N-methyltransferase SETMAR [Plakobranchus ocellatus]
MLSSLPLLLTSLQTLSNPTRARLMQGSREASLGHSWNRNGDLSCGTHCRDESVEKGHVYSTLECCNAEGEAFLQRILTGDESWVHHYDPECKAQSMEYRHKTFPSPRKFKVVASARKVLFTVFWDMEGVVHMEFLEQETLSDIFQHSELSNSD